MNVVISPTNIKLSEAREVSWIINEVSNKGKRISVFDSVFI